MLWHGVKVFTTVAPQTRPRPLNHEPRDNPYGLRRVLEWAGILMRVNCYLYLSLIAEFLEKRHLHFWSKRIHGAPGYQLFYLIDIVSPPIRRATAIRSSLGRRRLPIGKASDQAVVRLFCAVRTEPLWHN